MSKKDFYTDGMTVDEILNLGDDQIRALSKEDISRALWTVSMSANRRINNLLNYAVKRGGQYVEKKSANKAIALDALNKLAEESDGNMKFTVKGKTRNQMISELGRARSFMKLESSTIKGAENLRKKREVRTMKMTREQYADKAARDYTKVYKKETGSKPTKKQIVAVKTASFREFSKYSSDIWSTFRKWYETPGHSAFLKEIKGKEYVRYRGSDEVLDLIAQRTVENMSEEDVLKEAAKIYDEKYKSTQEEIQKEQTMAEQAAKQPEDDFDFGENF